MKWFCLLVMLMACFLLTSCISIPMPVPGILVSKDDTELERPSCFRFKGKLYVVGGYYQKKIPRSYTACRASIICNTPGMTYKYVKVLNEQVFEISDQEESFALEKEIKHGHKRSYKIDPKGWRDLGSLSSQDVIRDSKYYLELKGSIFAIGGNVYGLEDYKYKQYTDVWMSSNLVDWKQVTDSVPWSNQDCSRIDHRLAVVNNAIYLSGGSGAVKGSGKSGAAFNDVWRSEDGKVWEKVQKAPLPVAALQVFKLNNRYFYIDGVSKLYVSDDGKNWRLLFRSFKFGVLDGRLTMLVSSDDIRVGQRVSTFNDLREDINFEHGLYYSDDGLKWHHSKSGKLVSFVPRVFDKKEEDDMEGLWVVSLYYRDGTRERNDPFELFEFNNALWLFGNSPRHVYKADDGFNWKNVKLTKGKQFPPRSGAAIGAYNGYIWVMGGVWLDNAALGDIWRSSDGVSWELVTNNAPWGSSLAGSLFTAKGRLFLLKKGLQWDPQAGVVDSPRELWSTADGVAWRQELTGAGNIIVQAASMDTVDRIVETEQSLYLLDSYGYSLFLRGAAGNNIKRTHLLNNFRPRYSSEIRIKGKEPLFVSMDSIQGIEAGRRLMHWQHVYLKIKTSQEGRGFGTNFLQRGDTGIPYKAVVFRNRLFAAGVDYMTKTVYSAEMSLDLPNESISFLHGSHSAGPGKPLPTPAVPVISEKLNLKNGHAAATSSAVSVPNVEVVASDTLRIKVVEHLSWDSYQGADKGFVLGHKDNKPIVGMSFKFRLPDGSVLQRKTDNSGVVELKGLKPDAVVELSLESDDSDYPRTLFYERHEIVLPRKADSAAKKMIWKKSGLVTGTTHLFSY